MIVVRCTRCRRKTGKLRRTSRGLDVPRGWRYVRFPRRSECLICAACARSLTAWWRRGDKSDVEIILKMLRGEEALHYVAGAEQHIRMAGTTLVFSPSGAFIRIVE